MSAPVLSFTVYGEPKTAGSKSSGVATRWDPAAKKRVPVMKGGKFVTFTKDSSGAKGKSWRAAVADAGQEAMEAAGLGVFDCPLVVVMTFYKPRPAGHVSRRDGRLLPGKPAYPGTRPDALKLARAIEDALTRIVWTDDARIVDGRQVKVFCAPDEPQRVTVEVWARPETVGELALPEQESLIAAG